MRSDTPAASVDILDALLSGPTDDIFPGQEALDRLIRRAVAPPPKSRPAAPRAVALLRPAPAGPRPAKRKTTHYIDQMVSDRLDQARDTLAAMAARPDGPSLHRVTKSALVEAALDLALDAFEAAGRSSPLVRCLQNAKDGGTPPPSAG